MMQRDNRSMYPVLGEVVSKSERYSDKTKFNTRVGTEIKAHGGKYTANANGTAYSFNDANIEKLIWLQDGNSYKTNCFIDYQCIPTDDEGVFKDVYEFLLGMGLGEVEPPSSSLPGPEDKVAPKTYRAVLSMKDATGIIGYRGIIVNPPYPFVGHSGLTGATRSLALLAVAGLALLPVIRFLRRRH